MRVFYFFRSIHLNVKYNNFWLGNGAQGCNRHDRDLFRNNLKFAFSHRENPLKSISNFPTNDFYNNVHTAVAASAVRFRCAVADFGIRALLTIV